MRPVVEDKHLVQVGAEEGAEGAMGRVREVGITVGSALKGDKKAVGKAVSYPFHTDIRAPFKGMDGRDLARESTEGGLNLLDLVRRRLVFEFEEDDVTE